MQLAVTFTANDRPEYFAEVLESWSAVRGKENVLFYFSCEPFNYVDGNNRGTCVDMAENWIKENRVVGRAYCNSRKFGVLNNPYIALQRAFTPLVDYAILAEDDLVVADDILEYHRWAAETYRDDDDIAMTCSFSSSIAAPVLSHSVLRIPNFASVWIWGTWKDRWVDFIEPTWDHDYSTSEGFDSGWDWHLNTRVLPRLGKHSLQPIVSRVQNIGVDGTHQYDGIPMITAPDFNRSQEQGEFRELTSR